jgi:hypothetical protein
MATWKLPSSDVVMKANGAVGPTPQACRMTERIWAGNYGTGLNLVYCKVNKDLLTYVENEQFCCMRLRKHYIYIFA